MEPPEFCFGVRACVVVAVAVVVVLFTPPSDVLLIGCGVRWVDFVLLPAVFFVGVFVVFVGVFVFFVGVFVFFVGVFAFVVFLTLVGVLVFTLAFVSPSPCWLPLGDVCVVAVVSGLRGEGERTSFPAIDRLFATLFPTISMSLFSNICWKIKLKIE